MKTSELRKIIKEEITEALGKVRQPSDEEYELAKRFADSKGSKLGSIGVNKKDGSINIKIDDEKFILDKKGQLLKEGIFGSSPDREKRKLEDALDRFVKYSIENGDSEDEVLSTLEKKGRDAIDIYLGGKIDDDKLLNMYDDVMSNVSDQVMKRGK